MTHATPDGRQRAVRKHTLLPRDADLADLIREHGTFKAVARLLGASASGVAYRAKRAGIASPGMRGGPRTCSLCRVTSEDRTILRFTLSHYRSGRGERTTYGAGTILLCGPCWRTATRAARILPVRRRVLA